MYVCVCVFVIAFFAVILFFFVFSFVMFFCNCLVAQDKPIPQARNHGGESAVELLTRRSGSTYVLKSHTINRSTSKIKPGSNDQIQKGPSPFLELMDVPRYKNPGRNKNKCWECAMIR